jgi:tetratricopeptide (TPR) repeat protein
MAITISRRDRHRLESAEGYLLLEMPQQALRELDGILRSGFSNAAVRRTRGEALRELRRHEEALVEFEQADELDSDNLTTLMGMAWCLKRLDRLDEAIDAMQRAYRAHPEEPVVLYNIACYLTLADEKEQALSWLGRALRMEPKLRRLIPDEPDFDRLRDDPDFLFVITDPREKGEAT